MVEDPPWEDEFAVVPNDDEAKTKRDRTPVEAVPRAVASPDTTGKYRTLSGYGVNADVQSELAFGRGCAHCTKKLLMAFKLWRMAARVHPAAAEAQVEQFRMWMEDPTNAELVRVALEED